MFLISIYFDNETEKKLSVLMKRVAQVTGNYFMQDNHVPPHITIAAVETKYEDELLQYFTPLDGYVTRIGVAKTNPHRDLKIWEL